MSLTPFIETSTCLMPQHVPGARAGAGYQRIQMVPAGGTQGLIFTVDLQGRLRLWLNSEAGSTRWLCADALFAGDLERVIDFSVEQNVSAGRLDGTLDLMVITRIGDGSTPAASTRKWYVFNGLSASANAQTWRDLFASAQPLDTHGLLPESAHWGQAPRPYRSRLLRGLDAQGRQRLLWQRFDAQGAPLHDALEPPLEGPQPTQLEVACLVDFEEQGMRREGYARHRAYEDVHDGKAGYMELIWPAQDGQPRSEKALTALNGSPRGWDSGAGLSPLTLVGSGSPTHIYFDSTRGEQGVIAASRTSPHVSPLVSTLPGAAVPGSVRALRWQGDADRLLRFDLVRQSRQGPASLRLTDARDFSGAEQGRSTLLSDSVSTFSACLCSQPHSALQLLHVALVHEQGGIELLSQDSISGLWQRATLADDDVRGSIHEISTHTHMPDLDPQTRKMLERNMTAGQGAQPYPATDGGPASTWALSTMQDHAASSRLPSGGQWDFAGEIEKLIGSVAEELDHVGQEIQELLSTLDPQRQSLLGLVESLIAIISAEAIDVMGETCIKLCSLVATCLDAMWEALDQRLDIPVLTPLYEQHLAPGSKASVLDLLLLASAILGNVGSRAIASRPLISPQMAQAIANARSLTELLRSPQGTGNDFQWPTVIQFLMSVPATACRVVYFVFWMADRELPLNTTFEPGVVRVKCLCDTLAWSIAMAWVSADCAYRPPSFRDVAMMNGVYLCVEGLSARAENVIEFYYASQNQFVPDWVLTAQRPWISILGAIMFTGIITMTVAFALVPREEPSDPTNWNFHVAMPMVQAMFTCSFMVMLFLDRPTVPKPIRKTRAAINGLRSFAPALNSIGLVVAVINGWRVPGVMTD